MHCYNSKDMARSFRTVRTNTIKIAEEIPEEQYGYRAAPEVRTVAETLAHIAVTTHFAHKTHSARMTQATMEHFTAAMQELMQMQAALTTKAQILDALRTNGESFAVWLESLPDEALEEMVHFQPPIQMPPKSRFEMLLGTKEHEMHHRAQLMLIERMLGIVPHLTREQQERMAAMQAAAQQKSAGA
jgi:uncharacterized damage-inducible protein DinB